LDLIVTAAAGEVSSITVLDSTPTTLSAGANVTNTGAITITTAASYAGAGDTLIVDVSDIDDDDADSNADGDVADNGDRNDNQTVTVDASAATAGDYALDFRGSAMVDTVTGTAQADTISLGAGADVYNASLGADTITGGAGADTFTYTTVAQSTGGNVDSITDFTTTSDKLDVTFTTANGVNVDLSGFAANRASLADSLSTLDLTAGDHFYATNGSVAFDINGDGNITDGTDIVIDVTGTVASADIVLRVTGGTGGITITGSDNADFLTSQGVDTITAGAGADTITLPAAGTVQTVVTTGGGTAVDKVSNFVVAGGEDELQVDLSDLNALTGTVQLANASGVLAAGGTGTLTVTALASAAGDFGGAASSLVTITGATAYTAATLEAAIEGNGTAPGLTAGDSILIMYDDTANSYLALLTDNAGTADGTAFSDITITNLLELTGVVGAEAFLTTSFAVIA